MTLMLNHLAFERNNERLFHSINNTTHPGELLQIRGANGSGKSTLLRILAGFIEPKEGDVTWLGESIFKFPEYQQQLHYIGHQNGVRLRLNVFENMKLYCALLRIPAKKSHIMSVLQQVDLDHQNNKQVMYLSAGQLRRLALARLSLSPAKLWILDEPMTALDITGQHIMLKLVEDHLEHGGIAVIATHQALKGSKVIQL